jgi:hypothetical protein
MTLLDELTNAGAALAVRNGRVVANGRITARDQMRIRLHEGALKRAIEERNARWRAEVDACDRALLAHMARAKGYDEETIRRAVAWLAAKRPDGTFRVKRDRIEIELRGDVTAIFRHPNSFTCPQYWPEQGSRRCVDYRGDGDCARPEHDKCVEWLKVNSR